MVDGAGQTLFTLIQGHFSVELASSNGFPKCSLPTWQN